MRSYVHHPPPLKRVVTTREPFSLERLDVGCAAQLRRRLPQVFRLPLWMRQVELLVPDLDGPRARR